jgi:hypothetical protein
VQFLRIEAVSLPSLADFSSLIAAVSITVALCHDVTLAGLDSLQARSPMPFPLYFLSAN